jgi:MFS family permease
VTAALLLVSALASGESTVVSTAMPTIIGDLQGLPLYSWVFSLYLLSATVMMPLFGSLADLYGRRRVLLSALVLFLLGALLSAAARSMPQLIAARALQGLGAAGLVPIALTVVADLYSLRERPRVQGLFSVVWGAAALIGPLVGAWLTVSFGWRSIFSINIPLGALAFTLVATQMRESRASSPLPFDYRGALLLGVCVTALLFATLHREGAQGMSALMRGLLLAVSLLALVSLVREQARSAHPLLPPSLFTRAETAAPYLGGVLLGTTIFGVDTFVPLFVQGARDGTATAAGAVITPVILLWSVSASVAARVIVRHGFRRTAWIGALLVLLGFALLLAAVLLEWSVAAISLACGFIGAGLGFSSMSQILAVQHVTDEKERGVATSLVPFMRAMGGAVGVGALGGILSAGLSRKLGAAAAGAGQLLAGRHAEAAAAGVQPALLREALTAALLPIFALLAALATLNLVVTAFFPEGVER